MVFEQRDVEIPKFWSQQATNIVVSKYFRGQLGTPDRERSVKQLIGRVVDTITGWARKQKLLRERGRSAGVQRRSEAPARVSEGGVQQPGVVQLRLREAPQCSACFINSVQDTMDSILTLAQTEGMLFKFGSGTGTNLSPIRSSRSCSPAAAPPRARCRS